MPEFVPRTHGPIDDPRRVISEYMQDLGVLSAATLPPHESQELIGRCLDHKRLFDRSLDPANGQNVILRSRIICNEQFDIAAAYKDKSIGVLATSFAERFGKAAGLTEEQIENARSISQI